MSDNSPALRPLVLALHERAAPLAARVAAAVHGEVRTGRREVNADAGTGTDVAAILRDAFADGRPIIGICAAGILIRALAPLLRDKRNEPPVIAISPYGAFVVPLLGGHGGANALARRVAAAIGAQAVITTASDVRLGLALDEPPSGFVLANPQDMRPFMAALLAGSSPVEVRVEVGNEVGAAGETFRRWLRRSDLPLMEATAGATAAGTPSPAPRITLTCAHDEHMAPPPGPSHLVYHPKLLVLGVGMARQAAPDEVIALMQRTLRRANLSPTCVAAIGTIAAKADEPALAALARHLNAPVRLFSAQELSAMSVPNPSAAVAAAVGTPSVAEAAALLLAGDDSALLVEKAKSANATLALARLPRPLADAAALPGRARGRLFVVGLGPGAATMRTAEAREAMA